MSSSPKNVRKQREVYGENFKWDGEANWVAYLCYRVRAPQWHQMVKERLGLSHQQLEGRIQHYKSLEPQSKNKTARPTAEVKMIFANNKALSEEDCLRHLKKWLYKKGSHLELVKKELPAESQNLITENIDIDSTFKEYWALQKGIQKEVMDDWPWEKFIKAVSMMNIKSRGMAIERRLIAKNGWGRSARHEEGDAWMSDGSGVEIKTSLVTPLKGSAVSLTGLKLWETKVHHYLLIVVNMKKFPEDPETHIMWIPREEMLKEELQSLMTYPGMKKSLAKKNLNAQRGLPLKMIKVLELEKRFPPPRGFLV